nr:restriction endonuclease subunit S [Melioribacteraceae bacterium]
CFHIINKATRISAFANCNYLSEYSVDKNYIFQYLKFKENNLMELRVGSGLPNIQKNSLVQFNVVIPILFEQQKIADFLSLIDTKIEDINRTIEKTKEWKNGLLQQMLV